MRLNVNPSISASFSMIGMIFIQQRRYVTGGRCACGTNSRSYWLFPRLQKPAFFDGCHAFLLWRRNGSQSERRWAGTILDAVSGSLLSDHIEHGTVRGGSLLVFAVPAKEKHELYRLYSFFEKVKLRSVRSLFYRMNKSAVGFIRKCFFFSGTVLYALISNQTAASQTASY